MTVVPPKLREPMKKFKRLTGMLVITVGVAVLSATLAWLVAYFAARGSDLAALRASFGTEIGYWSPVLIFTVPGLLLVFHGKRMMRNAPISLLEFVEVLAWLVMTIVVFFFALE
jgi:hypothetical protein